LIQKPESYLRRLISLIYWFGAAIKNDRLSEFFIKIMVVSLIDVLASRTTD
jgi:hypothetical protein